MTTDRPPRSVTRRYFLQSTGSALAAAPLLGPLDSSPLETLNVASIGVGGMGAGDLGNVGKGKDVRILALCDVDANNLDRAAKAFPKAATFRDYRKLLDKHGKDLDAVVVSTPDHMHGPIALAAMSLGLHCYVQKPIAHNLHECRKMAELAASRKLVTQMGTQIHNHAAYRTAVATLRTGVIGKVREAHVYVSKSWAGPKDGRPKKVDLVPPHLEWDLWLGVAEERPYVDRIYHPANWRGWKDFGSGTLGDMGCHIFDPVFTALGIGSPTSVISRGPQHYEETFAGNSDIVYEFPGTEHTTEAITFRWTDGRAARDVAKAQLPEGVKLPGAGSFLVGEKGVMVIPHWAMPRFYREGEALPVELKALPTKNHYHEWTDACRGEGEASTPFSYSGPLTEAVLLGTVAGRFKDKKLSWDSKALSFGDADADAFVKRKYREGWAI